MNYVNAKALSTGRFFHNRADNLPLAKQTHFYLLKIYFFNYENKFS